MKTFDKKFSVIFPTAGDPLVLYMWFKNFKKYRHLTDRCFVGVDFCNSLEDNDPAELVFMVEYLREFLKENEIEDFTIRKCVSQHGLNIELLLEKFKDKISDNVLIAEEDDYVSAVHLLERNIEHYFNDDIDVMGPPIYMPYVPYIGELYKKAIDDKKMVIENPKYDTAFSYWPATFLIKKRHLYNSTMSFGASRYNKDESLKIYNNKYVFQADATFDTFIKFAFELMDNPDVKKITHINEFHRCYLSDPVLFSVGGVSERSIHDVLDFHVGGTAAFIYNRFWNDGLYESGSYYSRLKQIQDRDKVYMHIVDYYRTVFVMYNFLVSMRDGSKFPYYANYKKNMEKIIDLYETEYNVKEKIARTCDKVTNGLNAQLYKFISKKLF